ncbi:fatty acid CoA ligase family protein [Nibricoccus sp. IMCC34717]|uniref:fatty acid CoA ligase family protein n=1 Tax=Nibricoccus sp. IMCC34717 TaxID=3034021 RepID=UPI00384E9971
MASDANIARHLPRMARTHPDLPALKVPRGRTADGRIDYLVLSYSELEYEVAGWARTFRQRGVRADDRALVLVRQGLPLIAVVFALFRIGAVPVVIDPGMGLRAFLRCVRKTRPQALVAIPQGRLLSWLCLPSFRSVRCRVAVPSSPLARTARHAPVAGDDTLPRAPDDLAAILFTSGSTGAPKGVCYQHGQFAAQVELIRDHYGIRPGEIDLPMLPIFALFNPALGMTTIVPEMDPSKPASADPARLVQAILQEGVTNSFGSPTLWGRVVDHCIQNSITLPSLRRVLSAGAPVPRRLWEQAPRVLTGGRLHSPYGATECLPVSSADAELAQPSSLAGACVGKPLPGVNVRIVAPVDGPLSPGQLVRPLPTGQVGEIVVTSPTVTRAYWEEPQANAEAKVHDANGQVWHRMGDLGFLDERGCLWFCGRKVERVHTAAGALDTEPVERVFRSHAQVRRCALIGLGAAPDQQPALVVEPVGELDPNAWRMLAQELRGLARAEPTTAGITRFLLHPDFPVDVRHNAKIHRLTLARWACSQAALVVP